MHFSTMLQVCSKQSQFAVQIHLHLQIRCAITMLSSWAIHTTLYVGNEPLEHVGYQLLAISMLVILLPQGSLLCAQWTM